MSDAKTVVIYLGAMAIVVAASLGVGWKVRGDARPIECPDAIWRTGGQNPVITLSGIDNLPEQDSGVPVHCYFNHPRGLEPVIACIAGKP